MKKNKKLVEKTVLNTFQEEIPSIYFSDKNKSEYEKFKDNAEYVYRELFNFPKEMFKDKKLLDFGGGTGEQTVYLTNWGAEITHVEMNSMAIAIAKKVFQKHGSNVDKHRFVNTSIFDFDIDKKFDIVHSRGVFSHTYNKEKAFNKLASFLKPGGYLIFGDVLIIGQNSFTFFVSSHSQSMSLSLLACHLLFNSLTSCKLCATLTTPL